MNTIPELNTRVLVIDDEDSVRDSFMRVLRPRTPRHHELSRAAAALFGDALPRDGQRDATIEFQVDTAASGRDGVAMVERATARGAPYAVVFSDIRMPGWSGLEAVERIRALDARWSTHPWPFATARRAPSSGTPAG